MPAVQKPAESTALHPMLGTLSTLRPAVPAPGSTQSCLGALALQSVCELADATLGTAMSTSIAPANDSSLATRIVDLLARSRCACLGSGPEFVPPAILSDQRICVKGHNRVGPPRRGLAVA